MALPPGFQLEEPVSQTDTGVSLPPGFRLEQDVTRQASTKQLAPSAAEFAARPRITEEVVGGVVEPIFKMGSSVVGKIFGDVAGLGAIATHAAGLTQTDPMAVKQRVQEAMTYEPRTAMGASASNPLNAIPEAIGGAVQGVTQPVMQAIRGDASNTDARGMTANFIGEAVPQAVGFLGVKGAPVAKGALAASNATKAATLAEQAALDASRNQIRAAGQKIGLIAPARGVGAEVLSNIGGGNPVLSLKNRETITNALAQEVGLPKGSLTDSNIANRRSELGITYGNVEKALGDEVPTTARFQQQVSDLLYPMKRAFDADPVVFKSLQDGIKELESQLSTSKVSIPPDIAMKKIQQLRKEASTLENGMSGDPSKIELAKSKIGLANAYEDLIEQQLAESKKSAALDSFRSARKQLAQIHLIDAARMTDDLIDPQKLASLVGKYGKDKRMVTGNMKIASDFANTFPTVTKPIAKEGMATPSRWELVAGTGAVVSGNPLAMAAAVPLAARAIAPAMARRGMLQGSTPSYEISRLRRAAPYAAEAGMMGTATAPYMDEQ